MIKDFKLEILIYFNSPLVEHWTVYTKTLYIFPYSFLDLSNFYHVESTRQKATNVLWALEAKEQCVQIQPLSSS
jgi:hypothetical protein